MYGTTAISCVRHISMYYSPHPTTTTTTPTHNIILFSFLICHINTILFVRVFSDKYHSGHRHSIFPLNFCHPQFWVSLLVKGPLFFFRIKGECLKLWDCKRCAVKRVITVGIGSQWLVIVRDISFPLGFCQHVQKYNQNWL